MTTRREVGVVARAASRHPDLQEVATPGEESRCVATQGALRAPSPLHAFNRYEIKYLVDRAVVGELREDLAARLGSGDGTGTSTSAPTPRAGTSAHLPFDHGGLYQR